MKNILIEYELRTNICLKLLNIIGLNSISKKIATNKVELFLEEIDKNHKNEQLSNQDYLVCYEYQCHWFIYSFLMTFNKYKVAQIILNKIA
jgi:hypothetical protein